MDDPPVFFGEEKLNGDAQNRKGSLTDPFEEGVRGLVGHAPWGFTAGPGTGSVFGMDFGGRVPLRRPVDNPTIDEALRTHRGEYHLLVECAWRLEKADGILCTWMDSNVPGGPMQEGLRAVLGLVVTHVSVLRPALDLTLGFGSGLLLSVFCNRDPCYDLVTPAGVCAVSRPGEALVRPGPANW